MSIEVALLLSGISVAFALYQGMSNMKRTQTVDAKSEATQLATVIAKLNSIDDGVAEIKNEIRSVKDDVRKDHDRIIKVEERLEGCQRYCKGSAAMGGDGGE